MMVILAALLARFLPSHPPGARVPYCRLLRSVLSKVAPSFTPLIRASVMCVGTPYSYALTEINLMGPVGLTGALSGVGVVRPSDPEFYVPARGAARALASLHSPLPAGAPLRSRRPTPTAERSFSIR